MKKTILSPGLILALLITTIGVPWPAKAQTPDVTVSFEAGRVTSSTADVVIDGTTATITAAGSYRITGEGNPGRLVVDADGAVTLLLQNLNLTSADGPAIDIRNADEVTIYLPSGTHSTLTDAAQYTGMADGQDAAIFSTADLVIAGEGALTVTGQYADGIASRDSLRIEGGAITVQARTHGIKGKDYLLIEGGTLTVTAGGDGIKATNDAQTALGYVQIDGGTLDITAGDEGISAVSQLTVNAGVVTINTANNGMKSDGSLTIGPATIHILTADDGLISQSENISDDAIITVENR